MTNIAILTGRIARDPDTRETKGGTNVTGITVVTDRPARDKDGKTYKDENGYASSRQHTARQNGRSLPAPAGAPRYRCTPTHGRR